MKEFIIEETKQTPLVRFDPNKYIIRISGHSRPENAEILYERIINWFIDFADNHQKSDRTLCVELDFEYINSASTKMFLKLIMEMNNLIKNKIKYYWYFEKDDVDHKETGEELADISRSDFSFISK